MNIKMFVADIDGTLVKKGDILSPITKAAIERLHKDGVLIVPASGRPVDRRVIEKAKEWGLSFDFDYLIGMNGGDLYDASTKSTDHYHMLNKDTAKRIIDVLYDFGTIIMYKKGYDEVLVNRIDQHVIESEIRNTSNVFVTSKEDMCGFDIGKLEINYKDEDKQKLLDLVASVKTDDFETVTSYPGTLEFVHPLLNKGEGVKEIQKRTGIKKEEIISFGDMENDIGLFETAGTSVCMLNGSDIAKSKAKYITEYDVNNDGVGRYIFEHIYKEKI